jgi:UDP-N-acetylmuramyl pentapeptide phosphotransferase/UDP-N-acetylglucosamine-1-phosphate transferase
MYLQLFPAALAALALSLVLNRMMLLLAPRLGLMDEPGERRIHATPIPRAGGLAIWLSFLLVMGAGLAAGLLDYGGQLTWSWLAAFAVSSTVLVVAGILDDRKGLSPWVKLGAHMLAPSVFFWLHPIVTGFFPPGSHWGLDFCLFVGWTVVLINAFNLIDGLDGLCGGLAAVATVVLGALSVLNERFDAAVLLFVMAGAILGFLRYNINPARIFLGDAGSMMLGFFLATAATEAVGRKAVVGVILLPIAVAGVPLLDVLLAIWRRGARRFAMRLRGEQGAGGIFSADSDHLHHRLLRESGSQRKVALIMQVIAIVLAGVAFLPMFFGERLLGLSLVAFMIIALAGLRNLTKVEMEQTGNAIHLAIKVPGRRRRIAAVLFLYDLLVLTAAGVAAVMMETNLMVRGADPLQLGKFVVIFVTFGSVALLFAKVHQRLWVRATMRDILALQFWLLMAALLTFAVFSLIDESLEWSALRLAVLTFVFSCLGVCLPRGVLEVLRDLALEARHRSPSREAGDDPGYGPVVVYGAGDLGTLFLEHLKSNSHESYPKMRVLGFLDDTGVLHGRKLRSFKILGGLSLVPDLVANEGLRGIVLAIRNPRQELLDQLRELSEDHGLKIYRWQVGMSDMWASNAGGLPDAAREAPAKRNKRPRTAPKSVSTTPP